MLLVESQLKLFKGIVLGEKPKQDEKTVKFLIKLRKMQQK